MSRHLTTSIITSGTEFANTHRHSGVNHYTNENVSDLLDSFITAGITPPKNILRGTGLSKRKEELKYWSYNFSCPHCDYESPHASADIGGQCYKNVMKKIKIYERLHKKVCSANKKI